METENATMETTSLSQERSSILTQTDDTNMTMPLPQILGSNEDRNQNLKNDGNAVTLPRVPERRCSYSVGKPFAVKKFHFYNSTLASECKEKACLNNRLPDFTLSHKTLVSSNKFRTKTQFLPENARHRRARRTAYSVEERSLKKLPQQTPLRRSKSLDEVSRKACSFAGFGTRIETKPRTRKIIYEQKTREVELTVSKCWLEEGNQNCNEESGNCLMELDTSDDVCTEQAKNKVPKYRVSHSVVDHWILQFLENVCDIIRGQFCIHLIKPL